MDNMKNILFLVHRIPYPPNKGDKIRSYHFLKGLSQNYHVHLASFIDDPEDWQYVEKVEALTATCFFTSINPLLNKIKSLIGLITNQPLTVPYYKSNAMQQWIDKTISEKSIDKILVFSSAMAQFVQAYSDKDIIIDFVDVDSDKWLQYSQKQSWPMNWVYRREAKYLLSYDETVARAAKTNFFVSEQESKLFKRLVDIDQDRIDFVNNAVDVEYFNLQEHYQTPYPDTQLNLVFTGAMDYWPNIDAVVWFVNQVLPLIQRQDINLHFYIVGSKPSKEVLNLANTEGVYVTGRVEDIRPYLYYADLVVAPLLIARGIQNKVLEAMAMNKAVIATSQAIEGIDISQSDVDIYIKDDADAFAKQIVLLLNQDAGLTVSEKNRNFVEKYFGWSASVEKLINLIN